MRYFLFLSILVYFLACSSAPDFDDVPKIEFVSVSKSEMMQCPVGLCDSIFITLNFEDGDGDVGEDQVIDLNVIDNRSGDTYENKSIPMLPEQGASNGISGQITFKLFSSCCIFPDGIPSCESPEDYPTNELSLSIYMTDRAGNESNTITTSVVTLLCQ